MSSRKFYSSYDPGQSASYTSKYEPRESKVERENYVTKEDSKRVSENVSTSVMKRSVVNKRTVSSYSSKEESQIRKAQGNEQRLSGGSSKMALMSSERGGNRRDFIKGEGRGQEVPISSFYSSYYKDEDLSTAEGFDKTNDYPEDVVSAFYHSGSRATATDGGTDETFNFKADRGARDSKNSSRYTVLSKEGTGRMGDSSGYYKDRDYSRKLSRSTEDVRTEPRSSGIDVEDANILRRTLERRQASDSLDRDRIETTLLGASRIYPSSDSERGTVERDGTASSKVSRFLETDKQRGSASARDVDQSLYSRRPGERDGFPKADRYSDFTTRSSVTSSYGREYKYSGDTERELGEITDRLRKYDLATEKPGHSPRSSVKESSGKDRKRSLSSESRRRLGIYREIPGRKEFLAFTSRSTDGAASQNDDTELSKEYRGAESSDQYTSSNEYIVREDEERRSTDYLLQRSPSEKVKREGNDDYKYANNRNRSLRRQGNFERGQSFSNDAAVRKDIGSHVARKEPSIHDKLREDIAKLKAETEARESKQDYVPTSPFVAGRESLVRDKLKEDIAKLKLETLSREHKKPEIPPFVPRPDVSEFPRARAPSIVERRDSPIQEKLKADIAKLKADAKNLSLQRRSSTKELDQSRVEDKREVRRSEFVTTSSVQGNKYSKPDSDAFNDELFKTQRQRETSLREEWPQTTRSPKGAVPSSYKDHIRRPSDRKDDGPSSFSRRLEEDIPSWSRTQEDKARYSSVSPRSWWDDPKASYKEDQTDSAKAYATKKVYREDSTVSVTSTKNGEGPPSVKGYYRGSVSQEDHEAYFTGKRGDTKDKYPEEPAGRPEPSRRTSDAIPLPYPGHESIPARPDDAAWSPGVATNEPSKISKENKELRSSKTHTSREYVTRNIIRDDSIISRGINQGDRARSEMRRDSSKSFAETPMPFGRKPSIEDGARPLGKMTPVPREIIAPLQGVEESKPSGISTLRKKIDELKNKVDSLDDSRSRRQLAEYVHQHSEKKPEVEIQGPAQIRRYKLSERRSQTTSVADEEDPSLNRRQSTDITNERTSRQISRQTSLASTVRRISSIREEDLRAIPQTPVTEALPDEVFRRQSKPEIKPQVVKETKDAETMTVQEVQEQVGSGKFIRQESTVTEIIDERDGLRELRGVPIDQRGTMTDPQINQVVVVEQQPGDGVTTVQVDDQQKALVPSKDTQRWWNAFTAEDVDRLLQIGNGVWWNAYSAEDVDKLFDSEQGRRFSLRRGSFEQRSFRRYPRRFEDDNVDVHIRVRGRKQMRSPHYVFAQAAPEEKAIVLRDVKESVDPLIKKIKVDDMNGADAVRVENGVVKIKVGDLTAKGRKAWARILQHKDRVMESDGTVVIPVGSHYENGVYQTRYNQERDDDGVIRIPIKLTLQEMARSKPRRLRIVRDVKRGGSFRRKRRTLPRGYIAGAKYYNGEMVLAVDGSRGRQRSQDVVWSSRRDSAKAGGGEIVLRRNQPYSRPAQTIQRLHEGYRVTRQAGSWRNEGGQMVINVQAVPPRQPRFNIKQVGENMAHTSGMLTSGSYDETGTWSRDIPGGTGGYTVYRSSGKNAAYDPSGTYVVSATSDEPRFRCTSGPYIVSDPPDAQGISSKSGRYGVTHDSSTDDIYGTPTIIPYKEEYGYTGKSGLYHDSQTSNMTGYSSSKVPVSDARLYAETGYGEMFDLRDRGNISSVQIRNGPSETHGNVSERRTSSGRYRYGSSWNSKQQETLNGRRLDWVVEDVVPEF